MDNEREYREYKAKWFDQYPLNGYAMVRLGVNSKKPVELDWVNTPYEFNPVLNDEDYNANFGVVLNDDDLVVDVDMHPEKGRPGDKSLAKLAKEIGFNFTKNCTFIVKSPSGGYHFYFKKDPKTKIINRLKDDSGKEIYPGLEFRTRGMQMVIPGSRVDGKIYRVVEGCKNLSEKALAPEALLELIQVDETTFSTGPDYYSDSITAVQRYIKYLKSIADPAIEGTGGDAQTLKVAMKGKDYGLSPEKTYQLMSKHYNSRCEPPWSDEELQGKIDNAYKYGKNSAGSHSAEADFKHLIVAENLEGFEEASDLVWDHNEKGALLSTINNVKNYFKLKNLGLCDLIGYNELTGFIEFLRPAPWHGDYTAKEWSDYDLSNLKLWFETHPHPKALRFKPRISDLLDGFFAAAYANKFNPVRKYLDSLPKWDGVERLDFWLSKYCGAEDNLYTQKVGAKTLIAAVARIYTPGIKFDNLLILEGPQGSGKSSVCKILGVNWFSEMVCDLNRNREVIENILGAWVLEFSEMSVLSRESEMRRIKSFLSREADSGRMAYAKFTGKYPRQCVFIGTINPEGGYLSDPTGNRRFWPVKTGDRINLKGLEKARDQIYAEARLRVKGGESPMVTGSDEYLRDFYALCGVETEERECEDTWVDKIDEYIKRMAENDITEFQTKDIAHDALGIPARSYNPRGAEARRIANAMRTLDYNHSILKRGGRSVRVWRPALPQF